MAERESIDTMRELTAILRKSDDALVKRIRACLDENDIDPSSVVVAQWFPDDVEFEYGIVIDSNRNVFQFGYDYQKRNEGEGVFSEWRDITSCWKDTPLKQSVEIALENYGKIT